MTKTAQTTRPGSVTKPVRYFFPTLEEQRLLASLEERLELKPPPKYAWFNGEKYLVASEDN